MGVDACEPNYWALYIGPTLIFYAQTNKDKKNGIGSQKKEVEIAKILQNKYSTLSHMRKYNGDKHIYIYI